VHIDRAGPGLYLLGFSSLLVLRRADVYVHRLRGAIPAARAPRYLASLAIVVARGYGFSGLTWSRASLLIARAWGHPVLPVVALLGNSGHVTDDLGQAINHAGAVSEFGAVLIAVAGLPTTGGTPAAASACSARRLRPSWFVSWRWPSASGRGSLR